MVFEEILEVFTDPNPHPVFSSQEDLDCSQLLESQDFLTISGCGVFPVKGVNSTFDTSYGYIDVAMPDGADLGSLVFTKGTTITSFSDLTLQEFLAYLADVPAGEFGNTGYEISENYFISAAEKASEYFEGFYKSAPIWGGFTHYSPPQNHQITISSLEAMPGIATPSIHHIEAFSRYAHASNPLDRFLRLYHCVELLFDSITVLRIKALSEDIRGLSEILADHDSTELSRLQMIAKNFVHNPENLASKFCSIYQNIQTAEKIFQIHSKKGNPLNPDGDAGRWQTLVSKLENEHFSESDWAGSGIFTQRENYSQFVLKLATYWIYRVRCSIAHSRIGEYILEDGDQQFVIDFAEPLLLEFCGQVFTSQKLSELLS